MSGHPRSARAACRPARRSRVLLLLACLAVGIVFGRVVEAWYAAAWGYLAIPALIAVAWLFVADPAQCVAHRDHIGEGGDRQADAE